MSQKQKLPGEVYSSCWWACHCYSFTKWCPTLSDPMDHSMPGFITISLSFLTLMSIESVMLSSHFILCFYLLLFSFCLQSFPASGSFPMSRLFASSGQSIGASASALVLPMNIQGWFPLGLAGFISGGLCTLYIWDQQTIFPKTNLACCMLSCGPQTKNGFYIFKWLKRIKTKIIFQDKKIIWNSNFSVHIQVLLVHSLAFIYM